MSTEYIATHIPSGLVVDIIQPQSQQQQQPPASSSQSQQHEQQNAIGSHDIYGTNEGIHSPSERHFIASQEVSTLPMHALHQSSHSHHHHHHRGHHHHHFDGTSNGIDDVVVDRKVIISEQPNRQYIVTNEAPVIVSNKEVTAAMTMNDLDLTNSFPNTTFSHMDHSVLHEITKTSPNRMDDQQQHDLDAENQVCVKYQL